MTKVRAPLTFAQAITRIAGAITFARIAEITGRSDRAVRYWSEAENGGEPTLSQALALDVAYRAAGGDGAPILETYAAQLDAVVAEDIACRLALTAAIGAAAQECGEAMNHALAVTAPGHSPALVHRAITETEEAHGRIAGMLRILRKFLPAPTAQAATHTLPSQAISSDRPVYSPGGEPCRS